MSWLDALERALVLGRNKTVLLVADAVVSGLRPLVRRLHAVDPRVVVALRADELPVLPENALVLLDADAADLAWLNANRPFVAHRRLRLVIWWPGATRAAREMASDLLSWASEVLSCPQAPAGYAVRAFEALAEHRPGSIWPRALLQAVLDDRGRSAQWISGELDVGELVVKLRALGGRVPVFEGVRSSVQRRAVVQAMMEVEPPGPYVLVDAPPAEGWCVIEAPAGLGALVAKMPASVPVAARQRLAAVLDGEPRAAELVGEVLAAGGDADELFAALLGADDPLETLSARIEGGRRPCRLQPTRTWPPLERADGVLVRPTKRSEPLRFEPDAITWIHLSDIHAGQRGEAARPAVEAALERSITALAGRIGVPDLLLLTGDLAFSGKGEEYARVGELVARIERWLGREVPIFAVPGNHDLARPKDPRDKYHYAGLKHYEDEELVRESLWKLDPGFLRPLFAEYEAWVEHEVVPRLERAGHSIYWSPRVPGGFSAVVRKGELRLGVVGLNTAWTQVDAGDYEGKLPLPAEQLHEALPSAAQPLEWFHEVDAALLLTHHPRSWLSVRAQAEYERDVYPPGRFDLALFGHMHTPESLVEARGGTEPRCFFQAPSLFGLERYGHRQESRSFGYAWGRIRGDGELRVWPQVAATQGGGLRLVDDPSFEWRRDGNDGVLLREGRRPSVARVGVAVSEVVAKAGEGIEPEVLARYLAVSAEEHRHVRLIGFENRARVQLDLDEIFVPVDAVIAREIRGEALLAGAELHGGHETLSMVRAFHRARQLGRRGLVLLGDPGAGKTTFLKQMLLQVATHGAGSVGLPNDIVPVFLPLRALRDGETLDEFIDAQVRDPVGVLGPGFGRRLSRRGKLLLLLDGLDEVPDAQARARVARWIEQTRTYMPDGFMLVSCRYAGYTPDVALGPEFLELHLRPLEDEPMRAFVRRWYAVVERELDSDPERAARTARARAEDLIEVLGSAEIVSVARVYEMTRNPLLLTAICLVHRDQGRLPHARSRLYALCIEALLERWRLAREMPLGPEQVLTILQAVAAWMHGEEGRVRARYAELLAPVGEALAKQRGVTVEAGELLRMMRDDGGVLTGFGVDEYEFMHLGFQELLTAQHLRNEFVGGRYDLGELAARFGDSWWQEVILLLLAERNPSVFEPFMAALVRRPEFEEWSRSQMMAFVFAEAAEVSAAPFLELLRLPAEAGLLDQRLAVVELLSRRMPEVLRAEPELMRRLQSSIINGLFEDAHEVVVHGSEPRAESRTKVVHGVELVLVPGGRFLMGSPEGEEGRFDREGPQHWVELASFWLARTPVTNGQYREYMQANPGVQAPEYWGDRRFNQDEQPVVGVSWEEAAAYCEWAGLRLPTEAQWEYACRAGTTTRYCSGDTEADLAKVGWYLGNSGEWPHGVGELEPNAWGLYDMHGNVYEWCVDAFGDYATSPRASDGLRYKPVGAARRVVRGGCWFNDDRSARAASRLGNHPEASSYNIGFRPTQGHP